MIQVTHTKGCAVMDCAMESESDVWEGVIEGVMWCLIEEKRNKERGKEECPLLMYPRVWEAIKVQYMDEGDPG